MMTTEELTAIIQTQQREIDHLRYDLDALRKWSDLNDFWLREMIDALTGSVEKLDEKFYTHKCKCDTEKMGES